jgi:uncharacterized protein (TIGR00251 family)
VKPAVTQTAEGLLIAVHLQPRASKPGLGPLTNGADGQEVVKARVSAAPTEGAANAALCELIAKQLGLPKGAVEIERGAASRHKLVRVRGAAAPLATKMHALLRG